MALTSVWDICSNTAKLKKEDTVVSSFHFYPMYINMYHYKNISLTHFFSFILLSISLSSAFAEDVYQKPADFIKESFSGSPPKSNVLWITKNLKPTIYEIMGHNLGSLRIRYWENNGKTVWILNEIGKQHPITVGFVIHKNRIERLKVLIFRESRGWEVRHPFFTNQFKKVGLTQENKLTKNIDGISGATLSVIALKKLARLAIYFHKQVQNKNGK